MKPVLEFLCLQRGKAQTRIIITIGTREFPNILKAFNLVMNLLSYTYVLFYFRTGNFSIEIFELYETCLCKAFDATV